MSRQVKITNKAECTMQVIKRAPTDLSSDANGYENTVELYKKGLNCKHYHIYQVLQSVILLVTLNDVMFWFTKEM